MNRKGLPGSLNWDPAIKKVKELSQLAKQTYDKGDYLKAKDLSVLAEAKASKATHRMKYDLGFFALQLALQCYEEHLLEHFPELGTEYYKHAYRFYTHYSDPDSMLPENHISAKKTLAYRYYYKYFLTENISFNQAIASGNTSDGAQILNNALEKAANLCDRGEVPKWWVLSWKCKLLTLKVRLELVKPPRERSMIGIAEAYDAAATTSVPPEDTELEEEIRSQIVFYQHMHRSHAERWRANNYLANPSTVDLETLRSALAHFSSAAEEAEIAAKLVAKKDVASHCEYMSYWKSIVQEDVSLLEFVNTLDPVHLFSARGAISNAVRLAKSIVARVGEERVFPNRFYSVSHLESQPLWIDALECFSHADFPKSARILQDYCDSFGDDYKGSWRHSNALVRYLAAQTLSDYANSDQTTAKEHFNELVHLVSEEPCGGAAVAIGEELGIILRARCTMEEGVRKVLNHWPLSARADEWIEPTEEQTFLKVLQSLPKEIFRVMSSAEFPGTNDFREAWLTELSILLDFHSSESTERLALGRRELAEEVLGLKVFRKLSATAGNAICTFAQQPKNQWPERICMVPLLQQWPLVVHIQAPVSEGAGFRWYARPIWSRVSTQKKGFKIALRSTYQHDFSISRYWYLPPPYRKGHRPSLLLKPGESLKPCIAYETRPLTTEEVDAMRFAASIKFEDLVRRFLQAYLPLGFQVKLRSKPETDFFIELEEMSWVGEIKFTETENLSRDDAEKAIRQVERNAEVIAMAGSDKPIVRVIVTNAARTPNTLADWGMQGVHRDVWRAYLRETARDFVATGDGVILSVRRVADLDEGQVQIDTDYLRRRTGLFPKCVTDKGEWSPSISLRP